MTNVLTNDVTNDIEQTANDYFYRYFTRRGEVPTVPFPLKSMLKYDLKLRLGFIEIKNLIPYADSLGFLSVPQRAVFIDESLHPCEFPEMQGRQRFTIAHEIGHWCLHRHEIDVALGWRHRDFGREIVREREANRFASALMMPRELVRAAWRREFGTRTLNHEDLLPTRWKLIRDELSRRQFQPQGENAMEQLMFEGAVSGLAEEFGVSPQAMRIRCEELSLIRT
jgi:hypothetical protein